MGYSTKYSLKTELVIAGEVAELVDDSPLQAVIGQLRKQDENSKYAINDAGEMCQECKWYEHEKTLKEFSLKHPSILFTLHGEGEENDDIWNKYFLNGKCQVAKAQMSIAEFDAGKLA